MDAIASSDAIVMEIVKSALNNVSAEMGTAVDWIVKSGGVAVLAHPLRYQLTASWLRRLLNAFKEAGGQAVEIVTGRYNPEEVKNMADYAKRFGLAGSAGSDFHEPGLPWRPLGRFAKLPEGIEPLWPRFLV